MYKQTMWMVYRCTRKDEDYTNYKEAHNADMNEIRQWLTDRRQCLGEVSNWKSVLSGVPQ